MGQKPGIGIMVGPHGQGSNMAAIVRACESNLVQAEIKVVIASGEGSIAETVARDSGVKALVVLPGENYGNRLVEALIECDFLCLAGFLRILPDEVLERFPKRMLNIHPSLLPKFGGKGMYGRRVHEAVLAAGEKESGCTVHLVTEKYDEGPIVLQKRCAVLTDDTVESLAARVLTLEHQAYPEALAKLIHG